MGLFLHRLTIVFAGILMCNKVTAQQKNDAYTNGMVVCAYPDAAKVGTKTVIKFKVVYVKSSLMDLIKASNHYSLVAEAKNTLQRHIALHKIFARYATFVSAKF